MQDPADNFICGRARPDLVGSLSADDHVNGFRESSFGRHIKIFGDTVRRGPTHQSRVSRVADVHFCYPRPVVAREAGETLRIVSHFSSRCSPGISYKKQLKNILIQVHTQDAKGVVGNSLRPYCCVSILFIEVV